MTHQPGKGNGPSSKVLRRLSDFMTALLGWVRDHGRCVTLTEGVMVTGALFKKVESGLRDMATSSTVDVTNDPNSGTVQSGTEQSVFHGLAGGTPIHRSDTP